MEGVFYLSFCKWGQGDLASNPELVASMTILPSDLLKVVQGTFHNIHHKPILAAGKRALKERRRKTNLTCCVFCEI